MKRNVGPIGIDVSDHTMEIAQLRSVVVGKTATVHGYARNVFAPGIIKDGRLLKAQEFKELVRGMLSNPDYGNFDTKSVVLAMPEHQCYHHVFTLNTIGDDRLLYNVVQEKLVASIPFDIAEMLWDWMVVRQDGAVVVVYAVAMRRDVVESYMEALRSLGLIVRAVEPQVYSASRVFWPNLILEEPVVFCDLGTSETSVSTIDDYGIHQSSIQSYGLWQIEETLMKQLRVDRATAEKLARSIGLRKLNHPKIADIHSAIKGHLKDLVEEVQQHISYYHVQRHARPGTLSQLVITGGGSLIPGVPEVLANSLKLQLRSQKEHTLYQPAFSPDDFALYVNGLGAARRDVNSEQDDINVLVTRRQHDTKPQSWWSRFTQRTSKQA